MFKNMFGFLKRIGKKDDQAKLAKKNKDEAKERLHLVLMQDRANVSADFMDLMRQEIIEVIKKYIDVDENEIDVKLTNKQNSDGTTGSPALYANIPIKSIKRDLKMETIKEAKKVNSEKKLESAADKVEEVAKDKEDVNDKVSKLKVTKKEEKVTTTSKSKVAPKKEEKKTASKKAVKEEKKVEKKTKKTETKKTAKADTKVKKEKEEKKKTTPKKETKKTDTKKVSKK